MCINKQGIENDITSVQLSLIFNWSKADFHHWLSTAARELTTKPACPRKVSLSRSAFLLWFPARAKAPSFFRSLETPSLCTLSSEKTTFGGIKKKKRWIFTPTHSYQGPVRLLSQSGLWGQAEAAFQAAESASSVGQAGRNSPQGHSPNLSAFPLKGFLTLCSFQRH